MKTYFKLQKSTNKNKKYMVILYNHNNEKIKTLHFGASGYGDYPYYIKNKGLVYANLRKKMYIDRHKKRENWNDKRTAGFWSRWILWNKDTIQKSVNDLEKNKKIKFIS